MDGRRRSMPTLGDFVRQNPAAVPVARVTTGGTSATVMQRQSLGEALRTQRPVRFSGTYSGAAGKPGMEPGAGASSSWRKQPAAQVPKNHRVSHYQPLMPCCERSDKSCVT